MLVGAAVTHDAHRLDRQEHRERLPDLAVPAGILHLLEHDHVRLAKDAQPLGSDLAHDADAQSRPGEGLAEDGLLGQAEFQAEFTHLVLEQLAQRLDQVELHALGQAADVVV